MLDMNQTLMDETLRITIQLLQVRQQKPIKSVLVTSADPGEGKTTVASSLAVALAMRDQASILLIDANTRKPNIHTLLGLDLSNGFVDFLEGKTDMSSLIKDTAYPHLKVMTAGKLYAENTIPLLSSMPPDTKEALENDFEWVIYDAAPVNHYPDTLMAATLADEIILVILADHTRVQTVIKAKNILEATGAHILGGILNRRMDFVPDILYRRF